MGKRSLFPTQLSLTVWLCSLFYILTNDHDAIEPDESNDDTNSDNISVASNKNGEQDDFNSSTGFLDFE